MNLDALAYEKVKGCHNMKRESYSTAWSILLPLPQNDQRANNMLHDHWRKA